MALLTKTRRKKYFEYLKLGEYNAANIKKIQKKYLRAKDVTSKYDTNTDNLLRHLYNVKKYTKNFKPEDFKCDCGGKYCCGYPTRMKAKTLTNLQDIRDHFNVPLIVTSGLRCKGYNNSLPNSSSTSYHMKGKAVDFVGSCTSTLAKRKKVINYAKKLANHSYTYCNGWDSAGQAVYSAPMADAIHTQTK